MVPQMSVVVVSNRGPLSFGFGSDGELVTRRAAGGLASTLGAAVQGSGATWVAAAITEADRAAAAKGSVEAEGFRLESLVVDDDAYRMFYDVISSGTLWYLFHNLFDLPRRPRIDRRWREAWAAYRSVNEQFAAKAADVADEGATVLVHDYHLLLVGRMLADRRPDLRSVHFSHTPFCEPMTIRVLPDDVAVELFEGMAGYRSCGFHSPRWAANFRACSEAVIGHTPPTYVSYAPADADDISDVAASPACAEQLASLENRIGDRQAIVRVDRIELSKNLLRGFHAFEDLLQHRPEFRQRVVFAASVYPSREGLADYLAYRQEVQSLAERINETWATADWTPILLDMSDNFARSVAALRRYDVLLVNPIRDGLNLVAKEGAIVNERDGVLVLSREAGVYDVLAEHALAINPFDVSGTADAIADALTMAGDERKQRAAALREIAVARSSADWLAEQLEAAHSS